MPKNCSSTWFAASGTSPCPAPRNMKLVNDACSRTDRTMMSLLTRSSRMTWARAHNPPAPIPSRIAARASHRASIAPDHSAASVAQATPGTPQPSPITNHRSSPMLTRLMSICTARIDRVRSTAINQPVSAYMAMVAGAPQMRIDR